MPNFYTSWIFARTKITWDSFTTHLHIFGETAPTYKMKT